MYDLMGNPTTVTNGVVPYGRAPVYVESPGTSVDVFRGVVTNGTISLRANTAPPNISIVALPTGTTRDNPVKLRWLALDETSFPSGTSPNALQYSYMLDGHESEWSPWSAVTFMDYFDVPPGTYEFRVKAKDEAGKIANQFIQVMVDDPRPSRPTNLRILSGNP